MQLGDHRRSERMFDVARGERSPGFGRISHIHTNCSKRFNDLCCLAPAALLSPGTTWETIDEHAATAHFTLGANTIAAELRFDDLGDLVDFVADGRGALPRDGRTVTPMRWSTPLRASAQVGPARVATKAEVMWHPDSGHWTYGEFELTSLAYNVARRGLLAGRESRRPTTVHAGRVR